MTEPLHPSPTADLFRLPGLFRRWELPQVLEAGTDYRIEDAGTAGDGTPLLSVYRSVGTLAGTGKVAS